MVMGVGGSLKGLQLRSSPGDPSLVEQRLQPLLYAQGRAAELVHKGRGWEVEVLS